VVENDGSVTMHMQRAGRNALSGPYCMQGCCAKTYLLKRTTMAPITSPFLKSFFALVGWAL
jgi:hypothetical protein